MADKAEIEKGVAAHGMWKARLSMALETGKSDKSIDTIKVDNQCDFGKWLYGPSLTTADKATTHYKIIIDLHAKFHQATGHIAELATTGKKEEAKKLMAVGSDYTTLSSKLTNAMMDWKKSLA